MFDALGRKVTPYDWDKEVAPGVTAVGTPGHSIGHTSYVVSSGGKTVYVQSDVCNNAFVFAPRPDWQGFFDQDGAQAAATRKRVYDMLVAEKLPVQAYHFPFPALRRIEKAGGGYRVVPHFRRVAALPKSPGAIRVVDCPSGNANPQLVRAVTQD